MAWWTTLPRITSTYMAQDFQVVVHSQEIKLVQSRKKLWVWVQCCLIDDATLQCCPWCVCVCVCVWREQLLCLAAGSRQVLWHRQFGTEGEKKTSVSLLKLSDLFYRQPKQKHQAWEDTLLNFQLCFFCVESTMWSVIQKRCQLSSRILVVVTLKWTVCQYYCCLEPHRLK